MDKKPKPLPRYRVIAERLKSDILSGKLKPGDQLATEHQLCEQYEVSRHTAREALRILSDDGLIARRRRAGTVVADVAMPSFSQPIGDFESILQYARDARFELHHDRKAMPDELRKVGLSGQYHRFEGLRCQGKRPPLALTTIYALSKLAPDAATVSGLTISLSEWIERTHSIVVKNVTQRMEAVALDARSAKLLGLPKGSPALETVRRYRDAAGRVILMSQSFHPAGRFSYEMNLDRTRG
jgi:GntR family transcriptional regulator